MPSCHLIKGRRCRRKCRRSGNERIVGKSWRVRQSREATQTGELEEENEWVMVIKMKAEGQTGLRWWPGWRKLMILGKQRGTEAARQVQIGEAGGRETPESWFWLITISNGGIIDDHDNNDDSTPLKNMLFVQFEFLTTEQSEIYLCLSLFSKVGTRPNGLDRSASWYFFLIQRS